MKLKKKVVLQILEKSAVPLSLSQIRHRLGVKKQQHAKLKALLKKLVLKGKLHHAQGKFMHPKTKPPPQTFPPKFPRQQLTTAGMIGSFSKNPRGFGFVSVDRGRDVYVAKRDQQGALDGDRVEIVFMRSRHSGARKGKIVRIVERQYKHFLARLVRGKRVTLALPLYEKSNLPAVVISAENDLTEAQSGDLITGILTPSPPGCKDRYGKILRILPVQMVDELAFDLILTENQIATEFSEEARKGAESFSRRVCYQPDSGRVDLRYLEFVTIDGKDARDFDDAVYAEKQENGNYRLWISIADVAHYVQPNQPIDEEAYQRGTSVYFPTHAIPMLPEALSNHLCSLRPKVNRLTLTCEMEMDATGAVLDYSIYESIIRSQARLNYEEVADFLEEKTSTIGNKKIQKSLETMYQLSQILAKKRYLRGAVNFSFPEYRTELNKNREVTGFRKDFQSVSMKLIEQLMLEANETVARHCLKHKLPGLYRVHDKPDMFKMEKFQNTFWSLGIAEKLSRLHDSKNINKLLQSTLHHPNRYQIQLLLLKSMALACYRTNNQGHFGLAAEYYTHFTSPIRRYPDLIVHRALKAQILSQRKGKRLKARPIDSEIAEHLSQQERKAEVAEKQSLELVKIIFLEKYLGQSLTAQVNAVHANGIQVELTDLCLECFLPLESLNDDFYYYDETRLALRGNHSNYLVQAGTRLRVHLVRTDRINRKLGFQLENWLENQAA